MLNLHIWRNAQPINASSAAVKPASANTLAQAQPGKQVTITGYGKLAAQHRQHLQAYGLLPGRKVQVIAQKPVTILLVEQTELALENEIARQILIEA